jgi:hypothetical protein
MGRSTASGRAAILLAAAAASSFAAAPAGAEVLGVPLPAPIASSLTSGGPPDNASTFITPYAASAGGVVTSWKAEFEGGLFPPIPPEEGGPFDGGPDVPAGIQLKVFRPVTPTTLQLVGAGAVHDPRPLLQARFGAAYPFFLTTDAVLEFTDSGLAVQPGDLIGLTVMNDAAIGRYLYPLVGTGQTPFVLHDVAVGGLIDLSDIYTGQLPWPPAVQVTVEAPVRTVRIDIKPGETPNAINLGSNGVVAVAILSDPGFDATTVDPLTVTLAGAAVALRGKGTALTSTADVDRDGLPDLVVHVSTSALQLTTDDTQAVLEASTVDGTAVRGVDSVRVVN